MTQEQQQQDSWFVPRGTRPDAGWTDVVDGRIEGWAHTGLRTGTLTDGSSLELNADAVERIVVPLAGSFTVTYGGGEQTHGGGVQALEGRASVFDGPTDVLYLGSGTEARITGAGRVAVAEAPTDTVKPTTYLPRQDVPVELRGAGQSSRQVHNFGTPAALDAVKFIVCEVITPAGNWSSYPPHKHDTNVPGEESNLEEIYYYESAVTRGAEGVAPETADPFALHRTYASDDRAIDEFREVRTGDIALVPYGWHGPAVAAPGYDMYYLNVMAGPDPERVWNITDDPAHGWVRQVWASETLDPRLPYGKEEVR
ncbi:MULTISPECIES: 5-deoxy-glucuronate isomerase [unclassified Curtobacterium]|uniref:5-deoxy-glucuronate isomerase n=1 Tax=unclassified Curtobacterium TaxID=257496 RepID=UPI000F4C4151|nr:MULTISPECIES: 5-deoxy-glucuronate isomerase [unclassified Curtobacterium]ROP64717.1 5-deoxy-glucuronate isomerase [Curtobacterium sp. ZW137]TCK63635.1 5-deoxy-glucuronate isomerase [Curtobacterium sp. PhB136]